MRIHGLERYEADLIDRYNHVLLPGRPYSETAITSLQAALQGSGYFSSVRIETNPEEAETDETGQLVLPVHLHLRERQPNRVSFGVGASSNTGARVEAMYSTTDLGDRAWKLNTGMRLEERKQTIYSDLFLPPAYGRYQPSIGYAYEMTDISNLQTTRNALSVQRIHQRGSVDARLSINWQSEDKKPQGAEETHSKALAADGQWTWHHLDSLLNPRQGQVVQAKLGVAAKAILSDQDFIRSYARYLQYFAIGTRDTLTFRVELGYTFADSRDGIPEEYLFRAGGTNSVRGYAYNSLGVKSGEAIVGGRYLGTTSVEYTHWLDPKWGMALFVDAGNAGDDLHEIKPKYGAGAGARWGSPAGPIAVDLAWGEDSHNPRLHFFVAIPF
jgi:translocation and assembly module TamA